MNDGWLCDSILKTAASPSPMSTAPAFSPGPCTTRGPSVGSVLQVHARALVAAVLRPHDREQAEFHEIRLRGRAASRMRSYSSGLIPCRSRTAWSMTVTAPPPAGIPAGESCLTTDSKITSPSALPTADSTARSGCGMRPTTFRRFVTDAGDVVDRPVRIGLVCDLARRGRVPEDHAARRLQIANHLRAARSSCPRRARSAIEAPGPASTAP